MPSYPLSFPTYPAPLSVRVRRITVAPATVNPFTLRHQVQGPHAARFEIDVTLQKMNAALAQPWTQFFFDLQGRVGTFTLNLNDYCPGLSPAPGVRTFRLATNDVGWSAELTTWFEFSFSAVEDV